MIAIFETLELATLADLQHHLGDIPAARIRLIPSPGTATEDDVLAIHAKEKKLCELVDGVLVEKPMGLRESLLAVALSTILSNFIDPRRLGIVLGEGGMMKFSAGLVRIPDVSFISWNRIPGGKVPKEPVPNLAPDLAVEILSASNTPAEMKRKRREYFEAGVSLLWIVDPVARTVMACTSLKKTKTLTTEDQVLDGGDVLPGFSVALGELFAKLDRQKEQ